MSGREPAFQDATGAAYHWTGRIRPVRAGDVAAGTSCLIHPHRVGRTDPLPPVVTQVTEENAAAVGSALILAPGAVEEAHELSRALRGERGPLAGDVVRVRGDGYYAARDGELAVIGAGRLADAGEVMATLKAGAFRGPATPYCDGPVIFFISGGPSPVIPVKDLRATGESVEHRFWRWRSSPQADGGLDYRVRVPVWEWEPRG